MRDPQRGPQSQRGVVMVIALMMLTVIGLLAAWGIKSGAMNLKIVDNTQQRQAAFDVAQVALERTISDTNFTTQPAVVAAQAIAVDIDGDGTADMTAQLSPAPKCYRWRPVKQADLDAADMATNGSCFGSSSMGSLLIDATGSVPTGESITCAYTEWNVRAVVIDVNSGANITVNQGVGLRRSTEVATESCK